jgi:adenylate cyclase
MLTELRPHQLGWRLAVLPFRSTDTSTSRGIAFGMAEEISATLAQFGLPRLIATASFGDGSGPMANVRTLCESYHLDYVIEGTIDILNGSIKVDVSLIDVVLGFETVWNGHFEGRLDDLFSLQHRIAYETVEQVDPEIRHRANEATGRTGADVGDAHQAVLTAIRGIFQTDRSNFMQARKSLVQAIELDPDSSAAHRWLAYWSIIAIALGCVNDPRAIMELAGMAASRAIQLDPYDARALAVSGHVKAYILHDVPAALELLTRAIELNPNLPIAWAMSSWSRIYNGEHSIAIKHAMMSRSLSPRDPHIWFVEHALMTAQFFNRNLDEANRLATIVLKQDRDHVSALNVRLAILGHMGRREEALECLQALRRFDPRITVERIASRAPLRPADKGFYMEGLERGGVPLQAPP